MPAFTLADVGYTELARKAYEHGATSPANNSIVSSPNWMAFHVGLWAREHHLDPLEVHESRGYSWTINRLYKLTFKFTRSGHTIDSARI